EDFLNGKIHNIDLEALDEKGEKVEGVSLSASQISLSFKVSETKEVPIKLVTKGDVGEDYKIKSAKVTPNSIIIKGDKSVLSKVDELDTQIVDITGIKTNQEGKIGVLLPDNVEIYDGDKEVNYNINLVKKEKEAED